MKLIVKSAVAAALLFSSAVFAAPVNVNSATAEEISVALNGIGIAKARAIVEYREAHGPFSSADELTAVKGIGAKTVTRNRDDIEL